ncbi:MAG: hypothetical protein LBR64_10125 [Dysgonamonadaceae bacterium]|jgi:hypothetical protein|nr:hypothetical protein [Dysgonamonadaceae bacterium]
METNLANGAANRGYEKPATKKHEAPNIVQGSALYYRIEEEPKNLYYYHPCYYY